jgi:hypothetical protein
MKRIASLIALAAASALAGCASTPGSLDNRVVTTLSGDRAFANILFGPVGVTAELSKEDAAELKRLRERSTK